MGTKHINFLLALICLCNFDNLTGAFAQRRKSQVLDDDTLVVSARYDEDSLEDESESRSLEDDKHIRWLKDEVKELQDDLRLLTENKTKLWDELEDCLNKFRGIKSDGTKSGVNKSGVSESGGTKSKYNKSKVIDKCRSSAEGCDSENTSDSVSQDSTDDNYQDNSDEEEGIIKSLLHKISSLKKKKITLEKEIKRLTTHLKDCQDNLKLKVPTTMLEPLKIKRFIVRKKKVTWYKARGLCESEQKQLASITSQRDFNALEQAMLDQGLGLGKKVWIGGYRDLSSNEFFWKGNGSIAFTYTKWHWNQPKWSGEDEKCVLSYWSILHRWSVKHCDTRFNYACEYYLDGGFVIKKT